MYENLSARLRLLSLPEYVPVLYCLNNAWIPLWSIPVFILLQELLGYGGLAPSSWWTWEGNNINKHLFWRYWQFTSFQVIGEDELNASLTSRHCTITQAKASGVQAEASCPCNSFSKMPRHSISLKRSTAGTNATMRPFFSEIVALIKDEPCRVSHLQMGIQQKLI